MKKTTTSTSAKRLFERESSEVRMSGELVQRKVGGKIVQHFERREYPDSGGVKITKVKLPTIEKKK